MTNEELIAALQALPLGLKVALRDSEMDNLLVRKVMLERQHGRSYLEDILPGEQVIVLE